MGNFKLSVSTMAMLGFSLLYFFDSSGGFAAMLPAIFVHELGHAVSLLALNSRITGLHLTLSGFRMDYTGMPGKLGEAAMLAAGPLFGFAYAIAAAMLGKTYGNEFLLCSSGISFLLSVFNMLPAPMLDGGQLLGLIINDRVVGVLGLLTSAGVMLYGLRLANRGNGIALVLAGCWILIGTCKYFDHGIKYSGYN